MVRSQHAFRRLGVLALLVGWLLCAGQAILAERDTLGAYDVRELSADLDVAPAPWADDFLATTVRPILNETIAFDLNYTQFDYTLINSLLVVDPRLCLNTALTVGAANAVELLVLCTVEEVQAGNCSTGQPANISYALHSAGWTGDDYRSVALAAHLPASYFNFSSLIGEETGGLYGEHAFHAALSASAFVMSKLNHTLMTHEYRFAGAAFAALASYEVYAFVVVGNSPDQHCASTTNDVVHNTFSF
ncbi:hypothetical protein CDCA_CDCA14G3922 [Cyanidium caldarium]|uniref:Uncharacterized protein n=1 Tax=Cyanidium caldarium TaxID=2771 RepID=A0AAV9IZZ2_CYACA|nr:hypothetical protein CDCA_CDCA14G3922 [Cyanidium caldarium]